MATAKSAWGIEIGASALKAIRLVREGDSVVVTDFTVIPHQQVLAAPDVDPAAMVRFTLGQFLAANGEKLKSDRVVVSVAGRDAFARFAKLPVGGNLKNLAKLIDFESKQQIPFPIDQVEWDYQAFKSEDNIEVDVGIFAITKDRIGELRALLARSRGLIARNQRAAYRVLDRAFHVAIVEGAGNRILAATMRPLHDRSDLIWGLRVMPDEALGITQREHEAVLGAIVARDARAARDAMHAHLTSLYKRVLAGSLHASSTHSAAPLRGRPTSASEDRP